MATRRGLGNEERLGLDSMHASASSTLVFAPCFVYRAIVSLTDTNASGLITLNDVSASGDVAADAAKVFKIKLGAGGISAGNNSAEVFNFNPPIYVQRTLAAAITNGDVAVHYVAAS
jgi:hypothetical protein